MAALGDQTGKAHTKAVCALLSHRTMGRYLRQTKTGHLAGEILFIPGQDLPDQAGRIRRSELV
jgi:hypothetical protein